MDPVRLACVRHAASVRPEPGSNSPSRSLTLNLPKKTESRKSKSRYQKRNLIPTGTVLAFCHRSYPIAIVRYVHINVLIWNCLIRSLPNVRQPALAYLAFCLPLSRSADLPNGRLQPEHSSMARGSDSCSQRLFPAVWGEMRTYSLWLSVSTRNRVTPDTLRREPRKPQEDESVRNQQVVCVLSSLQQDELSVKCVRTLHRVKTNFGSRL